MIDKQIIELRKILKSTLKPMRYEHSLSVSFIASALAMCHDVDIKKAELAGIVHDCAKCYSDNKLIAKCDKQGILLTEDERLAPSVIHAKYGAWMARNKYGITDPEVLEAILWHTTGKADMSPLEMIVYIADYIEPRRDKAANLPHIRKLAFVSLEQTMYEILGSSLSYLSKKGEHFDPMTREAYEFYSKLYKGKQKGDTDAVK